MSKICNRVIELQENPCYKLGYLAARDGQPRRHPFLISGKDRDAWLFGFDARKHEGVKDEH